MNQDHIAFEICHLTKFALLYGNPRLLKLFGTYLVSQNGDETNVHPSIRSVFNKPQIDMVLDGMFKDFSREIDGYFDKESEFDNDWLVRDWVDEIATPYFLRLSDEMSNKSTREIKNTLYTECRNYEETLDVVFKDFGYTPREEHLERMYDLPDDHPIKEKIRSHLPATILRVNHASLHHVFGGSTAPIDKEWFEERMAAIAESNNLSVEFGETACIFKGDKEKLNYLHHNLKDHYTEIMLENELDVMPVFIAVQQPSAQP